MTRRQWTYIGFGAAVVLVAGFAIGFAISSVQSPSASPSPSPSAATFSCTVSIEPSTIVVNPDTGVATDATLVMAGTGFPPSSGVTLLLTGTALDTVSDASGNVELLVPPVAGETYPAPPDLEPGPLTWTVVGWDAPQAPGDFATAPPRVCETRVTITIELTHTPSPSPPTDLSAGSYGEILADGVRVRVQPALDATVVGALFTGDVVRIVEPAQVVDGLVWYRVESVVLQAGGSPIRGYIAAGSDGQVYLKPTTAPPPPTPTPSASPSPSPSGAP